MYITPGYASLTRRESRHPQTLSGVYVDMDDIYCGEQDFSADILPGDGRYSIHKKGRHSPAYRGDIHLHTGETFTCIEVRSSPACR